VTVTHENAVGLVETLTSTLL